MNNIQELVIDKVKALSINQQKSVLNSRADLNLKRIEDLEYAIHAVVGEVSGRQSGDGETKTRNLPQFYSKAVIENISRRKHETTNSILFRTSHLGYSLDELFDCGFFISALLLASKRIEQNASDCNDIKKLGILIHPKKLKLEIFAVSN